jgi:hypothetical protein
MLPNLKTILGMSALCVGLAATTANAAETRNGNFLFTCDGTNKTTTFTFSGLGISVNRFIQGAEVTLFENRGGLQYVILRAQGLPEKQLLSLGSADNSRSRDYTASLFVTPTSPAGTVTFTIDGACNGGFGQVQGNVSVIFFG